MKISILSDTHGYIDEQILRHLTDSDEIWHAGDIGDIKVIEALERLTGRLRAVYGNIDGQDIRIRTSENDQFNIQGLSVLITHIAGKPPQYNKRVKAILNASRVNVLVCGHSHILKVENDPSNKLLFINPGACGHHGFHHERTIIQFHIKAGRPTDMKVIELGKRGKLRA